MATDQGKERTAALRFEDLEVRMAYLEHMLGELDSVVCRATEELAEVRAVVGAMQRAAAQQSGESERTSLEEEVPPHY